MLHLDKTPEAFNQFGVAHLPPVHLGRQTHVWDAVVADAARGGRKIALFRCTQMILRDRG